MKSLALVYAVLILAVGLAVLFLAAAAFGAGPVVDEVERDGVDLLYAALAALVAGGGGLLMRRPQDVFRAKRAQNGTQAPEGKMSTAQLALDSIRAHELTCEEHRREMRGELEKLHARISDVKGRVADVQADVSYIKGLLDGKEK